MGRIIGEIGDAWERLLESVAGVCSGGRERRRERGRDGVGRSRSAWRGGGVEGFLVADVDHPLVSVLLAEHGLGARVVEGAAAETAGGVGAAGVEHVDHAFELVFFTEEGCLDVGEVKRGQHVAEGRGIVGERGVDRGRRGAAAALALDVIVVLSLVRLAKLGLPRVGGAGEVGAVRAAWRHAQPVDAADHALGLVRLAEDGRRAGLLPAAEAIQRAHGAICDLALRLGGRRNRIGRSSRHRRSCLASSFWQWGIL